MVVESHNGVERWAQFTYASFDDGTAPGGWQVKETVGELTTIELDALRSRVVTAFGAIDPLPQFPSPTQVDGFARRFTYAPTGIGSSWAYWHAAQAGSDGTGRPGNVFSHVVLDRLPMSATPMLRPALAWRSNWLAPFGQQQVVTSTAGGNPVLDEGAVGPEAVVAFLSDPSTWRIGVFAVLLDAVRDALSGGPTVVLVTDVPETSALWAAAVSLFMSAGASRRFAFSLFERATDLDGAMSRGLHLVAVPRSDADAIGERRDVVLIDDRAEPSLGDPGGSPHQLSTGTTVPASNWSVLAQVALADAGLALRTLRAVDEVAETVGDVELVPEWPLAMVVAAQGEALGNGELIDAADEAALVLAEHSPARLSDHPEMWAATVAMLSGRFGTTTEEAFAQADTVEGDAPLLRRLAARAYVERALDDRSWLARTGPVPIPAAARDAADDSLRQRADAVLVEWLERCRSAPPAAGEPLVSAAVEVLHLLDLMDGVGLPLVDANVLSPAERIMETLVGPVLVGGEGHGLVERTGPVGPGVRALARDVTASMPEVQHRVVGNVLIGPVLTWLYSGSDPVVPRADGLLAPLDRERVISACRSGEAAAVAGLRHLAFVDVERADRSQPSRSLNIGLTRAHEALVQSPVWTPEQVTEAWRFQVAVPDRVVARALGAARDSAGLDELVGLPLPEQLARAAPLGRVRAATQQLVRISRESAAAADGAASRQVDEILSALASSGPAADDLDPIPEIADPIIAAVAIRVVSSVMPVSRVAIVVAEKLASGANDAGVRSVLDAVIAEGVLPGADISRLLELFLRVESEQVEAAPPGNPLRDVSRLRLGGPAGSSVARVLAEAVFDARPADVPDAAEQAARLADELPLRDSTTTRTQHGDEIARRLFARWLGDEQPTKTRSGLLGRFGRNEVN